MEWLLEFLWFEGDWFFIKQNFPKKWHFLFLDTHISGHSLKSGPGTRDPRALRPGTWDPGPWDPRPWDLRPETLRPETRDPGLKPPDLGPATMSSKVLRPRPWELNLWHIDSKHPETSNWAPPQIVLTWEANFDDKKPEHASRKLRDSSRWTKIYYWNILMFVIIQRN